MINKINIKNFYSFKDGNSLVFSKYSDSQDPTNSSFFILGHNGSGKTNFLKSIAFLKWFILFSFSSQEPDEELLFDSYFFGETLNEPAMLEMTFSHEHETYKYSIELTRKLVVNEHLWVLSKNERTRFTTLFSRVWDEKKKEYKITFKKFPLKQSEVKKQLRKNCSLLSIAKYSELKEVKPIIDFWNSVWVNISYMGKLNNGELNEIMRVSKIYNEHTELLNEVVNLMKSLDIGLSKIEINENKKEVTGEKYYLPTMYHKRKDLDVNYPLPFFFESSGTKSLFVLLFYILNILKRGGVVVLDEIDGELHPLLMGKIVDIFLNRKLNKKGAQLILSTHNPHLINMVNKEQIILVEKNDNLESEIFKVSDIAGVRNDENYMAKYLAGTYGAVMKE